MAYAEQNMAATFDFAQKLMQAKDRAEVMGLQSEYLAAKCRRFRPRLRISAKVLPK